MTIDPEHQRRGAGKKLMEWGVRVADELGAEVLPCYTAFDCKMDR